MHAIPESIVRGSDWPSRSTKPAPNNIEQLAEQFRKMVSESLQEIKKADMLMNERIQTLLRHHNGGFQGNEPVRCIPSKMPEIEDSERSSSCDSHARLDLSSLDDSYVYESDAGSTEDSSTVDSVTESHTSSAYLKSVMERLSELSNIQLLKHIDIPKLTKDEAIEILRGFAHIEEHISKYSNGQSSSKSFPLQDIDEKEEKEKTGVKEGHFESAKSVHVPQPDARPAEESCWGQAASWEDANNIDDTCSTPRCQNTCETRGCKNTRDPHSCIWDSCYAVETKLGYCPSIGGCSSPGTLKSTPKHTNEPGYPENTPAPTIQANGPPLATDDWATMSPKDDWATMGPSVLCSRKPHAVPTPETPKPTTYSVTIFCTLFIVSFLYWLSKCMQLVLLGARARKGGYVVHEDGSGGVWVRRSEGWGRWWRRTRGEPREFEVEEIDDGTGRRGWVWWDNRVGERRPLLR